MRELRHAFDYEGSTSNYLVNTLAAMLICMEQTFAEGSSWGQQLPEAFLTAFNAYSTSGLINTVQSAIANAVPVTAEDDANPLIDNELAGKLETIIFDNRLRLHV